MTRRKTKVPDLKLPADLLEFLQQGKQLHYDPGSCEAGAVTLLPLHKLKVELFSVDADNEYGASSEPALNKIAMSDPHRGELGCYLVDGVNLIGECTGGYDPEGLLLWLPAEQRYATWDNSHCFIGVFGKRVTWSSICKAPARYVNAQWIGAFDDSAPSKPLVPWPRYRYSSEQHYAPQPVDG